MLVPDGARDMQDSKARPSSPQRWWLAAAVVVLFAAVSAAWSMGRAPRTPIPVSDGSSQALVRGAKYGDVVYLGTDAMLHAVGPSGKNDRVVGRPPALDATAGPVTVVAWDSTFRYVACAQFPVDPSAATESQRMMPTWHLYLVRVRDGAVTRLKERDGYFNGLVAETFSRDGTRLLFYDDADGAWLSADVESGEVTMLAGAGTTFASNADYWRLRAGSIPGKSYVVAGSESGEVLAVASPGDARTVDAVHWRIQDARPSARWSDPAGGGTAARLRPSFTPDGTALVFEGPGTGDWTRDWDYDLLAGTSPRRDSGIFVMQSDGAGPTRIATGTAAFFWCPAK